VKWQNFLSCQNDEVLLAWWLQLGFLGTSQGVSCWTTHAGLREDNIGVHSFLLLCEALSVHGLNLMHGGAETQPAAVQQLERARQKLADMFAKCRVQSRYCHGKAIPDR